MSTRAVVLMCLVIMCLCPSGFARSKLRHRLRTHNQAAVGTAAAARRIVPMVLRAPAFQRAAPTYKPMFTQHNTALTRRLVQLPALRTVKPAALAPVVQTASEKLLAEAVRQMKFPTAPTTLNAQQKKQLSTNLVQVAKKDASTTKDAKEKAVAEDIAATPFSVWDWVPQFVKTAFSATPSTGGTGGDSKKPEDIKKYCEDVGAFKPAGKGGITKATAVKKTMKAGSKVYRLFNCADPKQMNSDAQKGSWWNSENPTTKYKDACEAAKKLGILVGGWGSKLDCLAEATLTKDVDLCEGVGETVENALKDIEAKKKSYPQNEVDKAVAKFPKKDLDKQLVWRANAADGTFKGSKVPQAWLDALKNCK